MEFIDNKLLKLGVSQDVVKRSSYTVAYKLSEVLTNIGMKEEEVAERVKQCVERLARFQMPSFGNHTPIIAFTYRGGFNPAGSGLGEIEIILGLLDFSEKTFKTEDIKCWRVMGGMQISPTFNCQISAFRNFRSFYDQCHQLTSREDKSEEDLYKLLRYLLYPLITMSSSLIMFDLNEGQSELVERLFGGDIKTRLRNKYESTNGNNMEMLLVYKGNYTKISSLRKEFENVPLLANNIYASNELLFECH